jgi:ATP-binding cassette, subfamily C (CFTR/MRP), member 1
VNLIFFNYFWQISMVCGLKVRTALSSMVYQKSLRLSTAARQDFSSGKVMTVVSTDTARIEQFIIFAHIIWTAPIQILVLTGLMYYSIGYAAIVGVALLIVLTP